MKVQTAPQNCQTGPVPSGSDRTRCDTRWVQLIREEFNRVWQWEERHRRLVARLVLVVIATVVIDVAGWLLMYQLERGVAGSDIHTLYEAWFFTTTQLLTVSSQMQNPVTNAGRALDVALELWAVVVVAGSAGAFASFFRTSDRNHPEG
ncbi:MAG: hypothetical protein QOJ13_1768 [Gaiellales bacterium]|nr:hypothetical protein [Gaiellales bacterium]